ncbi:hypothetical protein MKW98_030498, partial [Papaver atlanticum]
MAQQSDSQNNSNQTSEVKEPLVKIQKVHENGVPEISSLLRVKNLLEKVVLPSRGSSLSDGYDLSRSDYLSCIAVAPCSGLTWKHSIDICARVIDADYRGQVGVILFNHFDIDFQVKMGDRVEEFEDLDSTVRGLGGFGSIG